MARSRVQAVWAVPMAAVLMVSVLCGTPTPASAASPAVAGATKRISVGADGNALSGGTDPGKPDVSADGRFVAFSSAANNLVTPADTNGLYDVFVTDRLLETTEKVSVSSSEVAGNNSSSGPSISDDGRYVAFSTMATNLGPSALTFGWSVVYVRDRQLGTTTAVSMDGATQPFGYPASFPVISGNGSKVAFVSQYPSYVGGDTNSVSDVFVRTVGAGIVRASVTNAEAQSDGSGPIAIDADGSVVAFRSAAAAYGSVGATDIYVRDLGAGTTQRASVSSGGTTFTTGQNYPSGLSADGRYLAFGSTQMGLVTGTTGTIGYQATYLRDRVGGTTALVSKLANGDVDGYGSRADISADGRRVVYETGSGSGAVAGATCSSFPVLFDRTNNSRLPLFNPTTAQCGGSWPSISADGRSVVASSLNPLVAGDPTDTSSAVDIYVFALAEHFFADVPASHPFFEEVSWAMDMDIAQGYDDGLYHPTTPVSRQAMAAFMYRMAGSPAMVMTPPTFTDVGVSHPFFAAIEWAAATGVVSGYDDGTFRPTVPVTRQAITKMVYGYLGSPLYFILAGTQTFSDVPPSHTFWFTIQYTYFNGIARGFPDGTFHPADPVTRQSAAAFLYRTNWMPITTS